MSVEEELYLEIVVALPYIFIFMSPCFNISLTTTALRGPNYRYSVLTRRTIDDVI